MANKAKIFLTKMVEVLEDLNTSLLSDNDLFYLVNSEISKKDRISMSYFEFLKSPNQKHPKSISQLQSLTEEEKEDFISAIRVGRIKQKMNLTKQALDSEVKNAYPNLWVLERKNTDLQLNRNQELMQHQPLIQITASNDNHKKMIDDILAGKPIIIDTEKDDIYVTEKLKTNEAEPADFEEINTDDKASEAIVEPLNENE